MHRTRRSLLCWHRIRCSALCWHRTKRSVVFGHRTRSSVLCRRRTRRSALCWHRTRRSVLCWHGYSRGTSHTHDATHRSKGHRPHLLHHSADMGRRLSGQEPEDRRRSLLHCALCCSATWKKQVSLFLFVICICIVCLLPCLTIVKFVRCSFIDVSCTPSPPPPTRVSEINHCKLLLGGGGGGGGGPGS